MSTRIGTNHFISFAAAVKYYAMYGCDVAEVQRKIADKEIAIGKPADKGGGIGIDSDGLYYYVDFRPAIRFIVHTVTSERDSNGNTYHFATVRSTITGKTLNVVGVGGSSNVPGRVMKVAGDWDCLDCSDTILPKRQHQFIEKRLPSGVMEHLLTAEMIANLER